MVKPVQVTFRRIRPHARLESLVHARAAWLETYYPSIVGCRVLIDVPHRHRTRGRHVNVRVELSLPGEDVVVGGEPTAHRMLQDVQKQAHHKADDLEAVHKHAEAAIREAFDAARRRLQDFARRQRRAVKTHEAAGESGRPSVRYAARGPAATLATRARTSAPSTTSRSSSRRITASSAGR